MIIEKFLEIADKKTLKNAFIFSKNNCLIYKKYQDVKDDMFKMVNFLKTLNLENEEVLLFCLPCYDFYITLLASLYLKITIVVIDSFKDQEKFQKMFRKTQCKAVFVDSLTTMAVSFYPFLKHLKKVKITNYLNFSNSPSLMGESNKKVLITFTSGTTGDFKRIERSLDDLEKQFELVSKTIDMPEDNLVVLSLLPIYVLANLVLGVTSYLIKGKMTNSKIKKEIKKMATAKVNAIAASVSKYMLIKEPLPFIKKAYTGGSLISLKDAYRIKRILPNAAFTYVYGSSETVLIAATSLDEYINDLKKNTICVGKIVPGLLVEINYLNDEAGEIITKGEVVLSKNEYHNTGDFGYIKDNKVYLLGRTRITLPSSKIYGYKIENEIMNSFPKIKKVCYLYYQTHHLFVEGKVDLKELKTKYPEFVIHKMKKLPMDLRHNYKTDINSLIKILK